jgi:hypothetical protein
MNNITQLAKIALGLVIILSLLPAVNGQDFSLITPELKLLPAPSWVKEGTRMSYYSATADIPSTYEKFILDEEGEWVGVKSGKHYRREEIFGSAGHGVTQVDVLSVEQGITALIINSWLYSSFSGPLIPIRRGAYIGPAAGGDWYINPKVLANLKDGQNGGVTILRMPYTVNGVTYNAIRIQQDNEKASFAHIYDLLDGKLIATFNAVASAEGGTTFAYATLLGVRQMNLPWLSQDLPQWLKQGTVMRFDGSKTYTANLAGYSFPTAVSSEMKITSVGQRYYTYTQANFLSASGFPSQYAQDSYIGGIGQPGGLVLPPAALATLETGQVIDADEVTGITVSVKDTNYDLKGQGIVVLSAANQAYSVDVAYDKNTGAMIAFVESKAGAESNEYMDLRLSQIS